MEVATFDEVAAALPGGDGGVGWSLLCALLLVMLCVRSGVYFL